MKFFSKIDSIDKKMVSSVVGYRSPFLTSCMRLASLTAVGMAWVYVGTALIVLRLIDVERFSFLQLSKLVLALIAPAVAWFIGNKIKRSVRRPRPFQAIRDFAKIAHSPLDESFPSLHAGSTVAFASALTILQYPFVGLVWVWGWAIVVSFSRVYLGVHYVSDLFGGAILGALCSLLVLLI